MSRGSEDELSLDTRRKVRTIVVRNAMLANAATVSFAAVLGDEGVKKLDAGDVAGAVVNGVILAYDTEKRLQHLGPACAEPYRRIGL